MPLDLIQRGKYQPRRDMDPQALEELAQSIKSQGVMQPIVVRPIGDNRFEIIAGERRWRASQQAESRRSRRWSAMYRTKPRLRWR